jgi:hypothetical protein
MFDPECEFRSRLRVASEHRKRRTRRRRFAMDLEAAAARVSPRAISVGDGAPSARGRSDRASRRQIGPAAPGQQITLFALPDAMPRFGDGSKRWSALQCAAASITPRRFRRNVFSAGRLTPMQEEVSTFHVEPLKSDFPERARIDCISSAGRSKRGELGI